MTSELVLSKRASRLTDKVKTQIIEIYTAHEYQIYIGAGEEQVHLITDDGIEMAQFLLQKDKWKECAKEFEERIKSDDTYH